MEDILVTVLCATYNHEKYIRKALEGFVHQKTTFKYQVIVHDDASTDQTASIIKEYERYECIQPYYQTVNQYSLGLNRARYINPLIKGKYIAFCEGDDYWTDENKLQVLADYMESHPECSMCCHSYFNVDANSEKILCEVETLDAEGDIPVEKAIRYERPTQLATQMFKKEIIVSTPEIFLHRGVGDYTLLLYAAVSGKLHFINKNMACHRVAADGSWTVRMNTNRGKRVEHYKCMIAFLNDFNSYCEYKWDDPIKKKIADYQYKIYKATHAYKLQIKDELYKEESVKRKIIVMIGVVFPKIAIAIEKKYYREK